MLRMFISIAADYLVTQAAMATYGVMKTNLTMTFALTKRRATLP